MRIHFYLSVVFGVVGASACGSTADVGGDYTLALTNHENPCMFSNWMEGDTTTNVPLTITQSDESVTASVGGLAGTALDIILASHVYTGTIDGEQLDLHIAGTRAASMNGCAYTLNSDVTAIVDGDNISGTISYRPLTNSSPDCGYLATCVNVQAFNGTRPPR